MRKSADQAALCYFKSIIVTYLCRSENFVKFAFYVGKIVVAYGETEIFLLLHIIIEDIFVGVFRFGSVRSTAQIFKYDVYVV